MLPSDGILIIGRDTKVKISLKSEVAENCSWLKTPAVTISEGKLFHNLIVLLRKECKNGLLCA